jgi:hypothetical protein
MTALATRISALIAFCLLLGACAQTGAPLPPSLELPRPPTDLRASRKGDHVTLTWSEPTLTTDRQTVRYLGPTLICRSTDPDMTVCGNSVQLVNTPPSPVAAPKSRKHQPQSRPQPIPQTYTDTLAPSALSQNPESELTYAVEVLNRNARGAGLSNRVHVPAIATLPAPTDLTATPTANGILLTWTSSAPPSPQPGVEHRYRIYRRTESEGPNNTPSQTTEQSNKNNKKEGRAIIAGEVPVAQTGPAQFLDAIEWERTYLYWVSAVTIIHKSGGEVQVEGENTPEVRIIAHDIFPPSVPVGLQAVYSGVGQRPFIDLIWAPVTAADLAGYNIYRSEGNGDAIKLNSEPVKSPSYRDFAVAAGQTYTYAVSAIDVRGNESARSEQAGESVP